jgi:hypothetical protein
MPSVLIRKRCSVLEEIGRLNKSMVMDIDPARIAIGWPRSAADIR